MTRSPRFRPRLPGLPKHRLYTLKRLPRSRLATLGEPEDVGLGFEHNLMALGLGELPAALDEAPAEIVVPPA